MQFPDNRAQHFYKYHNNFAALQNERGCSTTMHGKKISLEQMVKAFSNCTEADGVRGILTSKKYSVHDKQMIKCPSELVTQAGVS